MRVAYVSGPYRSKQGIYGVYQYIQAAREVALDLWRQGYAVVCPHLNSALMDGAVPDAVFLAGDLEIMRRCDLVVMLPDWQRSEGACAEREEALRLGMPVYEWGDVPEGERC
jgi:dienelactone hydrolase